MKIYPYILSGGSGRRLWPVSRADHPKQLQTLLGERTLLQDALALGFEATGAAPVIMANQAHRFIIAEQARTIDIAPAAIVLEPFGRNTAPAAIVAALHARARRGSDSPIVLLMPSDQRIPDLSAFAKAVSRAGRAAENGYIVTFGIRPTGPETAYGYIKADTKAVTSDIQKIAHFVEKPDKPTAESFLATGDYLWNAGIFVFAADTLLAEAERLVPDTLAACRRAFDGARDDLDFLRLEPNSFAKAENISLDHAIMERTKNAAVLATDIPWSDLGSWQQVWALAERDADGNGVVGEATALDCEGCLFHGSDRMIAGLGLRNIAVIDTPDALLVLDRTRAQDVKVLVERLKCKSRPEITNHRRVHRPWGWYEPIDTGSRHQVKILMIAPGGKLSLQSHNHRSEHWVVVRGIVKVTLDGDERLVSENMSAYVPLGTAHRLENPGPVPAQIIEVQTGAYLGEDDIVRYDDEYEREALIDD